MHLRGCHNLQVENTYKPKDQNQVFDRYLEQKLEEKASMVFYSFKIKKRKKRKHRYLIGT